VIDIRYHPTLVEQAVRLAARSDAALEHALHQDLDPIYRTGGEEAREAGFERIFTQWFTRLRLDWFVDEALSHFPRIVNDIREGLVHAGPRRKSEGAELFVRDGTKPQHGTLVIQLCPDSLVDTQSARDGLLRELQHVEDMLDPDFAYEATSIDGLPSSQQVTRDRYRILWDIRVEAMLQRRMLLTHSRESRLRAKFLRAFTMAGQEPPAEFFQRVWDQAGGTHAELLQWSQAPHKWFGRFMPGHMDWETQGAGTLCPLCRFPTFDWYPLPATEASQLAPRIRQSVPAWDAVDGICRQCAETLLPEVLT